MTSTQMRERIPGSLRLWPGAVMVALQWLVWFVVPMAAPDFAIYGVIGGVLGGVAVLVWWLFFSRAPWVDRIGAILAMVAAVFVTSFAVHASISNGMMGMMLPFFSIPFLCLALVAWAAASRHLPARPRRLAMVAAMLLACGLLTLIRTDGVTGEGISQLHWRWTPSAEERLLAREGSGPATPAAASAATPAVGPPPPPAAPPAEPPGTAVVAEPAPAGRPTSSGATAAEAPRDARVKEAPSARPPASIPVRRVAEWPGFRGPGRDSVVHGVRIATDWGQSPPNELWRRPIGPGWSSFAVDGDRIYTQEQRGEEEIVASYSLTTGDPVWRHADPVRFWESNGGAGPRGTPTLSDGRVYALGATGLLNALEARTGAVIWSRNAATDTEVELPGWGFASSPLVVDDVVIVALSGRLAAYDVRTGRPRWLGPTGGAGYSSPQLLRIDGVPQVVLLRGSRTISVAPADGRLLWEHTWQPGVSIVQPAVADGGDVLITSGDAMGGQGMRRIAIAHKPGAWAVEERWTSRGLKPYFNDFVVHDGHAFGFDGSILACIDLANGERKWKGGRYGHGQLLLLPDQNLLLVLSEEGDLALVSATSDQFAELARFKALEGKTWNHPVLVGDRLLVRNGEEMAAFRLAHASSPATR